MSRSDETPSSAAARSQEARRAAYSPPAWRCGARELISSRAIREASGSKRPGAPWLLEVDQQGVLRLTEQGGQLVHQTCWRSDVVVLGALGDPRLRDPIDPQADGRHQCAQHRAFQSRRRRNPRAHLDLAGYRHRAAANLMARLAQCPHDPRHIRRPALDVAGAGVQGDRDLAVLAVASYDDGMRSRRGRYVATVRSGSAMGSAKPRL